MLFLLLRVVVAFWIFYSSVLRLCCAIAVHTLCFRIPVSVYILRYRVYCFCSHVYAVLDVFVNILMFLFARLVFYLYARSTVLGCMLRFTVFCFIAYSTILLFFSALFSMETCLYAFLFLSWFDPYSYRCFMFSSSAYLYRGPGCTCCEVGRSWGTETVNGRSLFSRFNRCIEGSDFRLRNFKVAGEKFVYWFVTVSLLYYR